MLTSLILGSTLSVKFGFLSLRFSTTFGLLEVFGAQDTANNINIIINNVALNFPNFLPPFLNCVFLLFQLK
jgi:hypothetical protein